MATWTIEQLDRNTADGGVTCAHWRVLEVDGDYSASSYGTVGFTPDPSSSDFIPYADLTESTVLGWVQAEVDKDATEEALAANIAEQKTPTTSTGVPWQAE